MKTFQKILSVLLCAAMLFGLTIPAFAEGETLSVVYHYTDAETGEATTKEVTDGVAVDTEFAVNFLAPNTSEKYFIGWYTDEACTGTPVAKITAAQGVNNLYAGYKNYESVMRPNLYDAKTTTMTYPVKDAGGVYRATLATFNVGYSANLELGEEEGEKYWLRSRATGGNSSQSFPFLDENGVAYQFRKNTTYKISLKIKNFGVDGTYGGGRVVFGVGKTADSLKANGIWNGESPYRAPITQTQLASESQTRAFTTWTPLSGYISTTGLADDAHPLFFLYIESIKDNAELAFKDIVIEEVCAEFYYGDTLISAQYGLEKDAAITLPETIDNIPEGSVFAGWYLDKELTQAATNIVANGAIKLYAKVGEPPKAKYMVGETVVKEQVLNIGETYVPENFMLDSQYIPAGYYFTGWYSDAECTQIVSEADLTKEITVAGDFVRYAGLKAYEEVATPVPGASLSSAKMAIPFTFDGGEEAEDLYVQYLSAYSYHSFGLEEDYYLNTTGGSRVTFLTDANSVAYQIDTTAIYTISFDYKYTNTNDAAKSVIVGMGYKGFSIENVKTSTKGGFTDINGAHNTSYWATSNTISLAAATETETEWQTATISLNLEGKDLTNVIPVIGIGNGYMTNVTYKIKNIKVQKVVAKVNVHVGETVTTTEVAPGAVFVPEVIPEAPEGKVFGGWFLDAEYTQPMSAEGVVVDGEINLYAKFGDPLKATYIANGVVVKSDDIAIGGSYTPEYFMLDSQYIPEGYYFTGWYTDEACTTPVKVADMAKEIIVIDNIVRYAGLREYEKEFSPAGRPATVEGIYYSIYALQYPMLHEIKDEEGTVTGTAFTNYMPSNGVNWAPTVTEEEGETVFSYNTNALGVFVFHDENGKVFKAKPGASYKISYEYKFEYEESTTVGVYPNIGYPVSNITANTGNVSVQGYRLSGSVNSAGPNGSKGATMDTSKTEWTSYEATMATPEGTAYEPFFYIRNNASASTVYIKNIKVEMVVSKVVVHVGEEVTETEVAPGTVFVPETPAIPEGKLFVGWFLDENYETLMPEEGVTVEGEVNLYAKFVEPPKAEYIVSGSAIKSVDLTLGGTYTPENFMLDEMYIPDGYYFTGWYTDEDCTIPVKVDDLTKEITVTGDVIRYAGLKEYEKAFSPMVYNNSTRPATINQVYYSIYALQFPHVREDGTFLNFIQNRVQTTELAIRTEGEDTIISTPVAVQDAWIFGDVNGDAFQAKPGTQYKITYQYRYIGEAPAETTMRPAVGLPASGEILNAEGAIKIQDYRLSNSRNYDGYSMGPVMTWDAEPEVWVDYEATVTAPEAGSDFYPLFFIRNNKNYSSTTTVEYKNIKVEVVTTKVIVHVGEEITRTELNPGTVFIPDFVPQAPAGKEFKGWYLDADFTQALPEEGVVVNGEVNVYAKFGTPIAVVYNYLTVNGTTATKTVTENLIAGESFAINFVAPNTANEYFVGWYDNAEFTGAPITSLSKLADDANNLYARYKEFKTSYTVNFPESTLNTTVPKAYLPVVADDGTFHSQVRINSYWNGMTYVEDGGYYSIQNNGITQLLLVDEEGFVYQAREGAVYDVTLEYRIPTGDNSVTLSAGYGRPSLPLSATGGWGDYKTYATGYNTKTVTNAEWETITITIDGSEVDLDGSEEGNSPLCALIGLNIGSFTGEDTFEFRNLKVEEQARETYITSGGASVLKAEEEAEINAQALRVYFNYEPDENGNITIDGQSVKVVKRGVLVASVAKLQAQTALVKENVGRNGIIASEKSENLNECWANENGVLTYSTYIKNFEVDDEREIAVRGYIELEDGRIFYSEVCTYSVKSVKEAN